jgi:hypothetical protein
MSGGRIKREREMRHRLNAMFRFGTVGRPSMWTDKQLIELYLFIERCHHIGISRRKAGRILGLDRNQTERAYKEARELALRNDPEIVAHLRRLREDGLSYGKLVVSLRRK